MSARLAGLEVLVLDIERIERKAALGFRIAVVPVPLRGRDLQREIGRGNDELVREQPERGHRDDHQHQRRRDRPGEFEQAVMRPPRGHRIGGLVEAVDDIDDEPEHQQRNADRHRQQNPVVHPERCRRRFGVTVGRKPISPGLGPPKTCASAFGATSATASAARPALIAFELTRIPTLSPSLFAQAFGASGYPARPLESAAPQQ